MSPLRYFSTKKSYSCCYEQLHVYLYNENNKYKVHVGKKKQEDSLYEYKNIIYLILT